jgi:glucose/arabinose dehydrogenase
MRRRHSVLGLTVLVLAAACAGRFVVNAPILNSVFGTGPGRPEDAVLAARVRLPDGFAISVFAEGIRARTLRFSETGDLLVSAPRDGAILLLAADRNGDWQTDDQRVLLEGLDRPYGLDLDGTWLYVAEGNAIGRIGFDAVTGQTRGSYERIVEGLPAGGNHWTRTLRVGPDEHLYVTVGSSCNVCEEEDPRRAAMLRYRLDGSGEEIYATGLRNSVGFDWRPGTGELFATDNGRDLLGDDFPPCELNRVVVGGFYGWPYANGMGVPDPDEGEGKGDRIEASISPVHAFGAHTAPLGITFVHGAHAPVEFQNSALVAQHGSWNRSRKSGYKVVSLHWEPDGSIEERDFATGFELDENVIGRPVDIALGPDGAFYLSDDYAQVVYRIARGRAPVATSQAPSMRDDDPLAGVAAQDEAAAAARGAALYATHRCFRCHDAERADEGVVPVDYRPALAHHDLASLQAFLAAPPPPMPAYPLDRAQRRDLAIYLLSSSRSID